MRNNIHALCKCLCVPLVCMCYHALVLRASLLALINNSPVLLVRLPSSLHPLPQLSSHFPLTSSPLCPTPKHHPKAYTQTLIRTTPFITLTLVAPFSTPVLGSPQPVQVNVHLHTPPPLLTDNWLWQQILLKHMLSNIQSLPNFRSFYYQVYGPGFFIE